MTSPQSVKPDKVESAPILVETDPEATFVRSPTKLIRIASMTRAMLEEVKHAPLDDQGRSRIVQVHEKSLEELREVLSPQLLEEFNEVFVPLTGPNPTEAELRIAQAQLIGWLEGLFHGIQASLFSQQMAAQAQLAEMQKRAQLGPPEGEDRSGLYL
jgi:hypothetical protein